MGKFNDIEKFMKDIEEKYEKKWKEEGRIVEIKKEDDNNEKDKEKLR